MNQQKLFNYMHEQHGVILLQTDMFEIERMVLEPEPDEIEAKIDEMKINQII